MIIKKRKICSECKTERELWLHAMKNMATQLDIPEEITDPRLKEIYKKAEIAAIPQEKRITYISHIMSRNDELNSRAEMLEDALAEGKAKGIEIGFKEGYEDGREEGILKGREEGEKTKAIEIAIKLISGGMSKKEAAELVGISEDKL